LFSADTILGWLCVRKAAGTVVVSQQVSCKVKDLAPHTAQRGRISN
jgi:hypothetical protein